MIYVIVCGEYSDKYNLCYFTDREEAEKFAASLQDSACVEEIKEGKVTTKIMKSTIYTGFICYYTAAFKYKEFSELGTTLEKKPIVVRYNGTFREHSYQRAIVVYATTEEIARKICYDILAKFKYMVEIEGMNPEIACVLLNSNGEDTK